MAYFLQGLAKMLPFRVHFDIKKKVFIMNFVNYVFVVKKVTRKIKKIYMKRLICALFDKNY